ncbi:hypothetical protein [Ferrovum sp.]|uniref:hypothetical protein n=1 Tax=Ferrovum sp. TaxID=2609467 RepID=UPI002615C64A|nr:hypothetical protein [Ferrovum sp.]
MNLYTLHKLAKPTLLLVLLFCFSTSNALDLSSLSSSNVSQVQLAIYDIKPASFPIDQLESIVLESVKEYASGVAASRYVTNEKMPDTPGKITFNNMQIMTLTISVPVCTGAVSVIGSKDTSMARFGESIVSMACIFAYNDGYRVDYYAKYSDNNNTSTAAGLGSLLGKSIARSIGLGDSSKFIYKTIDTMEQKFSASGIQYKLVDADPAIANKTVQPDEIVTRNEAQKNADAIKNQELSARKELTSIGLNASSQKQLFEAIQHGDKLAVQLFIQADSLDLTMPDSTGLTPLQVAKNPYIIDMLKQAGAR